MNKLLLVCLLIAGSSLFCTAKAFADEPNDSPISKFYQLWSQHGERVTKIAPYSEELCLALEAMNYQQRHVVTQALDPKNMNGTFDYCN